MSFDNTANINVIVIHNNRKFFEFVLQASNIGKYESGEVIVVEVSWYFIESRCILVLCVDHSALTGLAWLVGIGTAATYALCWLATGFCCGGL